MSKLRGILLLLIAIIVMGCASQPQQPKEKKPVVKQQPVEKAPVEEKLPAEEKPVEPEKTPAPQPQQVESKTTGNTETTVYFAPGMCTIDIFTAHKLDNIAKQLKAKDVAQIKVVGHCAKLDSTKAEEKLSLQRALAVARYFESTGAFKANSITVSAEGTEHPAGSHAEISERKNNRRVEISY